MDIFLTVIGILLIVIGLAGCILPIIPGPPVSYLALIMLELRTGSTYDLDFLIEMGIFVAVVAILDYILPLIGTKKFGGSKSGVTGATIGMIIGFMFGPAGLIIGTFLGALIGELIQRKPLKIALKASLGSLLGFVGGIILKLAVSLLLTYHFFRALVI